MSLEQRTPSTIQPLFDLSRPPNRQFLHFTHLPEYADYIRINRLAAFSQIQLDTAREHNLPILQLLTHFSDKQLFDIFNQTSERMLKAISSEDLESYVTASVGAWVNDRLPGVSRHQIMADDVAISMYMRRKAFRGLVSDYTRDINLACSILEEVDRFLTEVERLLYAALSNIQNELNDQAQQISRIGNWYYDNATGSLFWSKELFELYELEPRIRLTQEEVTAFNHPDDAERALRQWQEGIGTGQPMNFQYRITLPSGMEKMMHLKGQAVRDNAGTLVKLLGTVQDVTEQYRLEQAKEGSDFFVGKIADLTPSMIGVFNVTTGRYIYINKAVTSLLGYLPEEVLHESTAFFANKIHPEDKDRIARERQEMTRHLESLPPEKADKEIREFKYRIRHKDGRYRWLQTFTGIFERSKDGHIENLINISNDITEAVVNTQLIQQKNDEIARSDERYFRMVDEVQDYAIFLLSPEGIIQNWNRGAEKIKGYTSSEIVGKHFRVFYPEEDKTAGTPEMLIQQCITEGKASHEGWRIRKDGSRFWASVVLTALHDNQGRVIGISKVTRDLTIKRLAEEQLRSYTHQLEAKNRELGVKNKELESFNYIASHDLQEPLRKIKLWAGRLEAEGDIVTTNFPAIKKIAHAADRMQQLIKGLLQYARMAEVVQWEHLDMNQELKQVLADYKDLLDEKYAKVCYGGLPAIQGVRVQIQQVLSNIVSNAIKYAKKDVPLVLDIRSRETLQHARLYYELSFSDNGIGFDQEYAEQIFKIFQRLNHGETPGTGVGLAICRKIAENHLGGIRAESETGVGTTIILTLPVSAAHAPIAQG